MKKFFLIPLMTLMCSVMAWAHNGHTSQLASDVAKAVVFEDDPEDPWSWDPVEITYYFATIDDAFAAQESSTWGNDCEIQLLKNATAAATLEWPSSQRDASWKTNNITLDLNGHSLTANVILHSYGSNKFTIKNGTFNGTLDYGQYAKGCFYLEGGTNGLAGTIACNVSSYYASSPYYYLNSGTISANMTFNNTISKNTTVYVKTLVTGNIVNGDNNRNVQLNMAGSSNVNLAKITGNVTLNNNSQLYMGNYSEVDGTVTMNTGSTLTVANAGAYFDGTLAYNAGSVSLTAGKFNFDPSSYLTTQYSAQYNSTEGVWEIVSLAIVNITKGINYTDANLMTAYAAAEDGDSLCVYKATTLSGTQNLNKAVKIGGSYTTTISAGSNITFSNPNQKIYSAIGITYDATVAFNEGTYKKVSSITNGDVTINGANVTYTGYSLTIPAGKTFTLVEGSFTGSSATADLAGTMNINGGTLSLTAIRTSAETAKLYMTAGVANFSGAYVRSNFYGGIFTYNWNSFTDLKLIGGTINYTNYSSGGGAVYVGGVSGDFLIKDITINSTDANGGSALIIGGEDFDEQELVLENCNLYSANSYGFWADYGYWTLKNNNIEAKKAVVFGQFEYPTIKIVSGTYTTTGENEEIIAVNGLSEIKVVSESSSSALFSKKPADQYIADGYTMEKIGDWWQLVDGPVVATVNGTDVRKYDDLLNAFLGNLSWITDNTINIVMKKDYDLTVNSPLEVEAGWTCNLDLNGHVLTVNGRSADKLIINGILNIDGSDSGSKIISQRANCFKVNEGGELNINGGTYKTTQQQAENITYSGAVKQIQISTSYIVRNLGGTVKLTNAIFDAGCYAVDNRAGNVTIKGGEYSSSASIATGEYLSFVERYHHYGYAIANAGTMSLINATVTGVHGAVICKDEKGVLDIDGCELITENNEDLEDANGALVVATNSMVSVKNTKMKSPRANYAAHVGDLDEGRTFGIVNIYAGCYLTDKMYVEQATASAEEILFPMSVAETSAWYEVAVDGGNGPLPAGYVYAAVENAGDDADEYAAGYRWKVVIEGEKQVDGIDPSKVAEQEADPTYTIPWQSETTWVGGEVPEENTIVTIPVDAVVVVSKDESESEAVAEQIFVSADATLKVETGTILTVGDGGINIANGGQLVVEKGAVVEVGAAGLITTDEDALVIEATEDQQGIFILNPAVTENTQPKASVKVYTNSKQTSENPWEYVYQRLALPIYELTEAPANDFAGSLYGSETVFENYLFYWNTNNKAWENCLWTEMVPFKGYQLANNSVAGGVTYTFTGNIVGNNSAGYEFGTTGFDFFGNSYTAPIYLKNFLDGFANDGVEAAVWIYDYKGGNYISATPADFEDDEYPLYLDGVTPFVEIPSMEGFILNLRNTGDGNTAAIDYTSSIWNNPRYGHSNGGSGAPKKHIASDVDRVVISVKAANGKADMVKLNQSAQFSNEFDNGADASKYFATNGINLYATTTAGELSRVATNDLDKTILAFSSNEATEYTLTISHQRGETFILRDNVANTSIEMTEGATYTFAQEANTTVPARFEVISVAKVPTAIENVDEAAKANGIYSITGQFLGRDFTKLPAGVYVVNGVKIVK